VSRQKAPEPRSAGAWAAAQACLAVPSPLLGPDKHRLAAHAELPGNCSERIAAPPGRSRLVRDVASGRPYADPIPENEPVNLFMQKSLALGCRDNSVLCWRGTQVALCTIAIGITYLLGRHPSPAFEQTTKAIVEPPAARAADY